MKQAANKQRGAVTLIGALFLVIVLSVMAIALLRMASSNILDSAANNDSTEALFIAESGVEYASFVYSSTGVCTSLAGIGPVNAGRGSFTLTNPVVLPGGECRVTVSANAGSTPVISSVRTTLVDLMLGQPGEAWAIGKNGELFLWNGTTWSASSFNPSEKLKAITCPTATECWAVGEKGIVLRYTGGVWSENILDSGEKYEDVACAPNNPNYCFLVGKNGGGVIRFWNGSTWTASTSSAIVDDLKGVFCPSTTCYAVGKKNQPPLSYNGSTWVTDGSNDITKNLEAVSCFSDTGCWAVGKRQGSNYTFVQRPGTSSTWEQNLVPSGSNKPDLESVYCVAANDCWAAGKKIKPGNDFSLVRWNGSSWTAWPTAALGKGEDLKDISCSSSTECFAVGKKGSVLYWNGSSWSDASSTVIGTIDLEGLAFMGGSTGNTVTIVRWQEIIGN